MLIVLLVAVAWSALLVLVAGLCVSAKRGDAQQQTFVLVRGVETVAIRPGSEVAPPVIR